MKALELIKKVRSDAKAKAKPDPVVYGSMAVGDFHRQGDVFITRLPEVPADAVKAKKSEQLAPGSTQGSRHCVATRDLKHCQFFALRQPTPLQGPIIKAKKPVEITHPEHGHVTVPPGVYGITYQRQLAAELRRVAD